MQLAQEGSVTNKANPLNFVPAPIIYFPRRLRRAAYRSCVFFLKGYMGKGKRIVVPACVVAETRKMYPNPHGVPYMGHMSA